jgi:hypothetical protein
VKQGKIAVIGASVLLIAAGRVTHRVEIDGFKYRVAVEDSAVLVANKGLVVTYSLDERDRQRQAVKKATGCNIVDELPSNDGRLRGKLDCK